jgi:hypothetical protein
MVNTSSDDPETMVDDEPTMLLSKARRCERICHGHKLRHLPHCHKPWSLRDDHKLQKLIPSVGWSYWGM